MQKINSTERYDMVRASWMICLAALVGSGICYRVLSSNLYRQGNSAELAVALEDMPAEIGTWRGSDVAIPEPVSEAAGNDDYLNRLYYDSRNGQWANVYVGYASQARMMLGHKPRVCYVRSGWHHHESIQTVISSASGREIPCWIHRFSRPDQSHAEIFVLNFYVADGKVTNDTNVFSALSWRSVRHSGYVAQVQISSSLENAVRQMGANLADVVLEFLPPANSSELNAGQVVTSSSN